MTPARPARLARRTIALLVAVAGSVSVATAQPLPPPVARDTPSDRAQPRAPALPAPVLPAAPEPAAGTPEPLALSAVFAGEPRPIRSGLVWRIFEDKGVRAPAELVETFTVPTPVATLKRGTYVVHVAYGLASATKRITMSGSPASERLAIAAGALKLSGSISDVPIPANRVAFSIFQPIANDSEGKLIAANVRTGDIVRLPEGTYHVVSTYGESNAIMRADLKVERGQITEATLNHRAATVTLKLIAGAGGEAFAGTAFSVLTPGGDVIREAIGAFPTVTLAEGEYVLIARHDGKVYTREFKVESGLDRDVEVMVTPG